MILQNLPPHTRGAPVNAPEGSQQVTFSHPCEEYKLTFSLVVKNFNKDSLQVNQAAVAPLKRTNGIRGLVSQIFP